MIFLTQFKLIYWLLICVLQGGLFWPFDGGLFPALTLVHIRLLSVFSCCPCHIENLAASWTFSWESNCNSIIGQQSTCTWTFCNHFIRLTKSTLVFLRNTPLEVQRAKVTESCSIASFCIGRSTLHTESRAQCSFSTSPMRQNCESINCTGHS